MPRNLFGRLMADGGLFPNGRHTIRLTDPEPQSGDEPIDVQITEDDGIDLPEVDETGAVVSIKHGDGTVTVSLDGKPIADSEADVVDRGWFANLAEKIAEGECNRIAEELLRGIANDEASRQEWLEAVAEGIKLLGLKTDAAAGAGTSTPPVEGMSTVRHPLLLEAVLRFQANARSELLPTDGPIKVRDDSAGPPQLGHNGGPPLDDNTLADALELDLNHYLTAVATEYVPDSDRMLFKFGLAGTAFKKVYFCPLRMRPVSETVDCNDLIVSNDATDLGNAKRITHNVMLKPSTVKRLQILGVYADIELSTPNAEKMDALKTAEKEQQGVKVDSVLPEDRDRQIYECYCELDIVGYEHMWKGKVSGLDLPYRVTIDVTAQKVLSIVRNYNKPAPGDLPEARKTFVKYTFVPGLGFLDIGLLDILGNTTRAVTAAWREMLDNGMFANFPGWLQADFSTRQKTNVLRIAPGSGQSVQTNGMPIKDAIMPLPYETSHMPALMSLVESMVQTGQRIGGTSELQVGEGRPDAPVGTTLAIIEQATKVLNSVHKRMHASQAEEFKLLVECFREHPESFIRKGNPSNIQWTEATFLAALNDNDLVPQADPNTASHGQRMMKGMGLKELQKASPNLYDPLAVDTFIIEHVLGFGNPAQFFVPPEAQAKPPPELVEAEAKAAADAAKAQADGVNAQANVTRSNAAMITAQAKAKEVEQGKNFGEAIKPPDPLEAAKVRAQLMDAETRRRDLSVSVHEMALEDENRDLDRQSKHELALLGLAKDIMLNPARADAGAHEVAHVEKTIGVKDGDKG